MVFLVHITWDILTLKDYLLVSQIQVYLGMLYFYLLHLAKKEACAGVISTLLQKVSSSQGCSASVGHGWH
jgi:hypothetical protein